MRISDWSSDVCSSDLCRRWRPPGRSREWRRGGGGSWQGTWALLCRHEWRDCPAIVTAVRELNTRPQVPAGGWGCLRWSLVPSPTTTPSERATCQTRPMTTRHCLVTGANRGVGLEFVRQLLARGRSAEHTSAPQYLMPN